MSHRRANDGITVADRRTDVEDVERDDNIVDDDHDDGGDFEDDVE